jgi:hypothetical protein
MPDNRRGAARELARALGASRPSTTGGFPNPLTAARPVCGRHPPNAVRRVGQRALHTVTRPAPARLSPVVADAWRNGSPC